MLCTCGLFELKMKILVILIYFFSFAYYMIPVVETKDGTLSVASAFAGYQEGTTFVWISF